MIFGKDTEKLLLFGGAIQLAGQVKAKRDRRSTRSDWMAIERERGISVVTSVMTFEYGGRVFNLLDTPGHEDFSEDTYRTLTAVDSAVMVIDAAKGIEPRTRKLFEVCRLRDIPIITFINKMDRESRDPFDLIDEIEKTLAVDSAPIAWPVGRGRDFVGTIDVKSGGVRLLDGDCGSAGSLREMSLAEIAAWNSNLDVATLGGELDLVRQACKRFDPQAFTEGHMPGSVADTTRLSAACVRGGGANSHVGVRFQDPGKHGSEPSRSYFSSPKIGRLPRKPMPVMWSAYPITELCASATL
jgi:peptide chain release factor 3